MFLYAEKGGVPTVLIMAIVIPFAVSIALFCMCFCFLRRARKTRDYVPENDGKEKKKGESFLFCTLPNNIFKRSKEYLLVLCSWR